MSEKKSKYKREYIRFLEKCNNRVLYGKYMTNKEIEAEWREEARELVSMKKDIV